MKKCIQPGCSVWLLTLYLGQPITGVCITDSTISHCTHKCIYKVQHGRVSIRHECNCCCPCIYWVRISDTYDMEDAMILNKSSVDRGMFYGQIYQTQKIDLSDPSTRSNRVHSLFKKSNVDKSTHSLIDSDGLPYVGQLFIFDNKAK